MSDLKALCVELEFLQYKNKQYDVTEQLTKRIESLEKTVKDLQEQIYRIINPYHD